MLVNGYKPQISLRTLIPNFATLSYQSALEVWNFFDTEEINYLVEPNSTHRDLQYLTGQLYSQKLFALLDYQNQKFLQLFLLVTCSYACRISVYKISKGLKKYSWSYASFKAKSQNHAKT